MKLYYKIVHGYDKERETTIDEDELEKACGLFITKGRGFFRGGAIDGKVIQNIVPDYHAIMGWNATHRLDSDDHQELEMSGVKRISRAFQNFVEQKVGGMIKAGQTSQIGVTPALQEHMPVVETKQVEGVKSIGELLPKHAPDTPKIEGETSTGSVHADVRHQ